MENQFKNQAPRQNRSVANYSASKSHKAIQKKNNTGLSDKLKSGIENLSGYSMDDVRVYYNSPAPAQLHAHAFAKGTNIHVSPGQERQVPHEAWHVVQQKQGRVRPTMQMKGNLNINDDKQQKGEANVMGTASLDTFRSSANLKPMNSNSQNMGEPVLQPKLIIAEDYIPSSSILRNGPEKKGIDKAISRRIKGLNLDIKPFPVRIALAALADSENEHKFDSMREAIEEAIRMGKNGVDGSIVNDVEGREDSVYKEMLKHDGTKNFPQKEIWRLLLDGKHQATRGKYGFENEKGYMKAMMTSFQSMLTTIGTPLDADMYEQLHDRAVHGVKDRGGNEMEEGYRKNPNLGEGFGLDMDNWSPAGHEELLEKYRNKGEDPVGALLASNPNKMIERSEDGQTLKKGQVYRLRPMRTPTQAKELATEVIGRYHAEIQSADNAAENEKLSAIARVCQDLDQMHLFTDGNIRTVVFLVLNKLLIEQGFSPVIMSEPNIFDAKSVEEIKAEIKKGQSRFMRYQNR